MMITSAGIFGYLSNAFQAQSLQLQQVDREILVYSTKIEQNTTQITQLNTQLGQLSSTQSTILEKGKVNSRLLRSIDSKDKQVSQINKKISDLQDENAKNNEKINEIKVANLGLEKEVGGFRFIAEAFGMELKNVVKFFIFLIVIVFDPLAVALIIAFNGLIVDKKRKQKEILTEMMENDQKLGLYEVYGDTKEDIVEDLVENEPIIEETPQKEKPYWEKPDFNWENKNLWINNPLAVKYWMANGNSIHKYNKLYKDHLKELDNIDSITKTY